MPDPPPATGERLPVLFIGDRGHHVPYERIRSVFGSLAQQGFQLEWEEDLSFVTPERLGDFSCVVMYANQAQHSTVPQPFMKGLRDFVQSGGGFVALHCTTGCFMESPEWLEFVGARFVSHGGEVFTQEMVVSDHPLIKDWIPFESWDETYVQTHVPSDRTVLAMRGEEPWMWVRNEGKGRVFYTASGHDERTWTQPEFLDLLARAIDWTAGEEAASKRASLRLPEFSYEPQEFVPNYEAREKRMDFQLPSTPNQAQAHLIPPVGFEVQLFAAEPMVINPIAMDWDAQGRCWVIETPDYPNEVHKDGIGTDRISILEDTNGDGRADQKTIFADHLNLPTGLQVVSGGVVVAMAPHVVFMEDEDGDDQCDARTILTSGFGRFDTHAGPSNLYWGPDNALWGAVGYSSYTHASGERFGSGLWRLPLSQAEPEFVAQFTNNTWGLGWNDAGDLFGSTANGAPSFYAAVPKSILSRVEEHAAGAQPIFDNAWVHPALPEIRQGDWLGQYTSAAGHEVMTGSHIPTHWEDRVAMVCSPTAHTVGRFDIVADGAGWKTRNALNVCASTDEWFCPVQASVGPDGAIWIADFAQFIILHNLPGNPERGLPKIEYGDGNAHFNPMRDKAHGRIWRLVSKKYRVPSVSPTGLDWRKQSGGMTLLGHENRFWRTTARRLLVEAKDAVTLPWLMEGAHSTDSRLALECVRVLAGMGNVSEQLWKKSLQRQDLIFVKGVLGILTPSLASADALVTSGLLHDPRPQVQFAALKSAARMPSHQGVGVALSSVALENPGLEGWRQQALAAAVAAHADPFLQATAPLLPKVATAEGVNLIRNGDFEEAGEVDQGLPLAWSVRSYGGSAQHQWVEHEGRGGSRALLIESLGGADTSWCTEVEVEPHTRYRLKAWVKTEGLTHSGRTHGALVNVHPTHKKSESVHGNSDWTEVSVVCETGPGQKTASLNCLYGGWGHSTGRAYWDDVSLVSLGPSHSLSSLIQIAEQHALQ
ncbi:MAG: ThuA domain-containing protein, partial [Planctomycetes bacterium]|nr:ThuA domain-containing protein [Planctomycetota bacterium]